MTPLSPYYRDLVSPLFKGKKCVLAIASVADSMGWVTVLQQVGVEKIFILAPSLGAGALPTPDVAEYFVLETAAKDALESFRRFGDNLKQLPHEALRALDRFDPEKTALVLPNTQFSIESIGGRKTLFSRPQAWSDVEDKTKVEAIWKALGISHAPSQIVLVDEALLSLAHERLQLGEGTVWSGDSREGFNGGSCYVRQVNNPKQFREAFEFFREHCDYVRVMPFLSGVPCSRHGMVFPDRVMVGRTVEQLVFLRPQTGTFQYGGVSTTWDPAEEDVHELTQTVKHVGEHLRRTVNYRGAFSLDGIQTEHGFFPTEINTRFSSGIITQGVGMPEIPLALIDYLLRAGVPLNFNSADLERKLFVSGEENRRVAGWVLTRRPIRDNQVLELKATVNSFEKCGDHDQADATVTLGPSDVGGMVRVSFSERYVAKGEIAGPAVLTVLRYLDRQGVSEFGELVTPYPSVAGASAISERRFVS